MNNHKKLRTEPGKNRKVNMERYQIFKNKRLFASFTECMVSRFGKPFSRDIALLEFDSCVAFWSAKGVIASWELRISTDNTHGIMCRLKPQSQTCNGFNIQLHSDTEGR
jgi:hypothetical protein